MRKHIIISILSAFILIPSCRREIVQEEIDKSIIVTSQSSYPDVKSAISGSIEEGFEIRWNINDALGVYSSFGTANSEHKIIELKKEGKAIFSGKVKKYERELKLYAYSPYNPDAGSNPNEVSLHHPSQQVMVGDP